jgi:hypothetical protein
MIKLKGLPVSNMLKIQSCASVDFSWQKERQTSATAQSSHKAHAFCMSGFVCEFQFH